MPDFPNSELGLKQLRLKTFEALQTAKAAGHQTTIDSARDLLGRIDDALNELAIAKLEQLATELRALTQALQEAGNAGNTSSGTSADLPTTPPAPGLDNPDPPPPGPAATFVSARKIADKTILFIDEAGREFVREGGSRSWRNFNPGNIRKGDFSKLAGSIGDDGAFAIFPDERLGKEAIVGLLRTNAYKNLTLVDAVFRYAPPSENNSAAYANSLESETGIDRHTVISNLTAAELRRVAGAIQKIEGWIAGTERPNGPHSAITTTGGMSSSAGAASDWMSIARAEAALPANDRTQWADPGENPRILNYFKVAAPWFEVDGGDEVDWCAAFVNYCLMSGGYGGTNHPGARSFFWNKNKHFVKLDAPAYGAVAVRRYAPFDDTDWVVGAGHVGFVVSSSIQNVTLLGGNQGRTVSEMTYPLRETNSSGRVTSEFVAFMMPAIS